MQQLLRHRIRRTTLFLLGSIALVIGVGVAHFGQHLSLSVCSIICVFAACSCYKKTALAICGSIIIGLSLGLYRGGEFVEKLNVYQTMYGHKITIKVVANNDGLYGKKSQITFDGSHITTSDHQHLTGKVQVSGFGVNSIYQGDTVVVSGKLYPGFGQYQAKVSYAQLRVVDHHMSIMSEFRRKFTAGMQSALPEPVSSFGMGLLIGQRATLPVEVKQDLLMVGLTHIIAVSGYNLTIMLNASQRVFGRRSKKIACFLSLSLIFCFLLITGSSASIIRAAIVSMLSIAVAYYGRRVRPVQLICFAAAITAWAQPFYVWSDASWYLSFLAFFGVLVIAPAIQARWRPRWRDSLILAVALESICAEAMTVPYVLYVFHQTSLIGLPANVIVVTLIPLAMLLSALAGLAGMLAGSIAGWIAWPATLVLTYMLDVAHTLSHIPHVFLENIGLPLWGMTTCYLIVCAVTLLLRSRTRLKSGILTDRNLSSTGA